MDDTKPALTSTGVWGSIIAIAAAVAPPLLTVAGVTLGDQKEIVNTGSALLTALGATAALIGRLRATKRLT